MVLLYEPSISLHIQYLIVPDMDPHMTIDVNFFCELQKNIQLFINCMELQAFLIFSHIIRLPLLLTVHSKDSSDNMATLCSTALRNKLLIPNGGPLLWGLTVNHLQQ